MRRRIVLILAAVVVIAAPAMYLLLRTPTVRIHGTFTQIEPLPCTARARTHLARARVVFMDQEGREVASTGVTAPVRARTETVLGFAHCREWAAYQVTVPRVQGYVVQLPMRGARLPPVSYGRLAAHRFKYDFTY
jgi:hypothetical protein